MSDERIGELIDYWLAELHIGDRTHRANSADTIAALVQLMLLRRVAAEEREELAEARSEIGRLKLSLRHGD